MVSILRKGCHIEVTAREYGDRVLRLTRLIVLAGASGAAAGVAAYAFLETLSWATRFRIEHGWMIWLLPAVGLLIGVVYTYFGGHAARGTRLAVREARQLEGGVEARVAPLIFGAATAGHLFGASVGREGAAVQMSASITDTAARLLRLGHDDRQDLLVASLAGGFSAIVGTPVAGFFFATQLTKRRGARPVLASAAAAAVGDIVVHALRDDHSVYPTLHGAGWNVLLPFELLLAGAIIGLLARLYMSAGDRLSRSLRTSIRWAPLRPVVGGAATIALAALVGRDYLGLSLPLLGKAVAGGSTEWWAPLLKLLFTVIAIGSGFVGGEVIPLFVLGATSGSVLARLFHVSRPMLAACGLATLFTSAAQISLTGVVLATELFGWHATIPAAIVATSAWLTVGSTGLYVDRGERADDALTLLSHGSEARHGGGSAPSH